MAMRKRDESNKEKTPSSYNQTPIPISSSATAISKLANTNTPPNTQQISRQFPNIEEPIQDTSHPPPKDRSTNQGQKTDTQAAADLLALLDPVRNSPSSEEEGLRPGLKRGPSPSASGEAPSKKQKIGGPLAPAKKTARAEPPIQFVNYLGPPQPKRKSPGEVIWDDPITSPSPSSASVSPPPRPSSSPSSTWHRPSSQPPQALPNIYPVPIQTASIAPGPFAHTVAPHVYAPPAPVSVQLLPVPPPLGAMPHQPMLAPPWPAAALTNYQIHAPPIQFYGGAAVNLEQLLAQRLQNMSYPSSRDHVLPLLKICLPDQPLNFFKTNVTPPMQAPVMTGPQIMLRPFREPLGEGATTANLPPLASLIPMDAPSEAQRSSGTHNETTRGPPKKLPLHFLQ